MAHNKNLYKDIIRISADYLGPAAKRFIDRQIQNHLHKDPDDNISKQDLSKLIEWISASMSLLTDNKDLRKEYTARLKELANDGIKPLDKN